jgi:hypothetical protein
MNTRPSKSARLLRRKIARRAREIARSTGLDHRDAHAALMQLRSITERLNRIAA